MIVLEHSIEINATKEKLYEFFQDLTADKYSMWHHDHVSFEWIKGNKVEVGAIAHGKQYVHGKLHPLTVEFTELIPSELIVFKPLPKLWRIFCPKFTWEFKSTANGSMFTARVFLRMGLSRYLRITKQRLALVRKHLEEEGENLKRLIEQLTESPKQTFKAMPGRGSA